MAAKQNYNYSYSLMKLIKIIEERKEKNKVYCNILILSFGFKYSMSFIYETYIMNGEST